MKLLPAKTQGTARKERDRANKSLNATPKLCVELLPGLALTVMAFADWARVNSMLDEKRFGSVRRSLL